MTDYGQTAGMRPIRHFKPRQREFLQNPLWYVLGVTCLAGLTIVFHVWWWLTSTVALVWGLWLVWHIFTTEQPAAAADEQLAAWLEQALYYCASITKAVNQRLKGGHDPAGQHLSAQVATWADLIQKLVSHLALLRGDDLLQQELDALPQTVAALEDQLAGATDSASRDRLAQVLSHRRRQLESLKQLQTNITQAEIQIESALSLLGTVYVHILTGQSVQHVAANDRLLADVDEAAAQLRDRLEALLEVKSGYRLSRPVRSP